MKTTRYTYLCVLLGIAIQTVTNVLGDAILEVHMLTYRNPTGSVVQSNTCDLRFLGKYWRCDTYFVICLENSVRYKRKNNCDYLYAKTGIYQDQNNIVFGEDMNSVPNPIKVHFRVWPGSVLFRASSLDSDYIKLVYDPMIDTLSVVWTMEPARTISQSKWSNTQVIKGTRRDYPTSLTVQYRLYCTENYYNSSCERHCVATNGPKKHTFCDPATGAKLCQTGWEGADCDIVSNDCIRNNCTNGASCEDGHRTYTCLCGPGFTGRFCEVNIDECASKPCENGGTCLDKVDSFACHCKRGYFGPTCSHYKCDNADSHCMNYGTCVINNEGLARCHCPKAYTGDVCEREKCLDVVCENGGTCVDGSCACRQGYVGHLCDVKLCDQIQCMNGATCKDGNCICTRGYTGIYCTVSIDVRGKTGSDHGPKYTWNNVQRNHRQEYGQTPSSDQATTSGPQTNTNGGPMTKSTLTFFIAVVMASVTFSMP